jgi:hypothetical protein
MKKLFFFFCLLFTTNALFCSPISHDQIQDWVQHSAAEAEIAENKLRFIYNEKSHYLEVSGSLFEGKYRPGSLLSVLKKKNELIECKNNKKTFDGDEYLAFKIKLKQDIGKEKKRATSNYKIHLMPKSEADLQKTIQVLVNNLSTDEQLRKSTLYFKVLANIDLNTSKRKIKKQIQFNNKPLALIVIYPASGKENAQYVLDSMYNIFYGVQGLDITPRYNKRITNFLYYAQGDGDYKTDDNKEFFDKKRIHFCSNFEEEPADYTLQNPATRNELPLQESSKEEKPSNNKPRCKERIRRTSSKKKIQTQKKLT